MSQPQKKKKLTPKEETFVKTYVVTQNGTKSALAAYDIQGERPLKIASAIATEKLSKPVIQEAIAETEISLKRALIDNGVTPEKIALKVNQLLEAETPIYKNNNATKMVELVGYSPDFGAIDKGLKHATNIYGVIDLEKPKIMNTYNNFFFNEELREKVRSVEEDIKQALLKNVEGD